MPESQTFNMDCMIGIKEFPDKFFNLALVDCPYGIGEDGTKNKSRGHRAIAKNYKGFSGNDKEPPPKEFFVELFRISKNQIIFGANHFIEQFSRNSSCWIVWDKLNGKSDFADCELAWTSLSSAVRIFRFQWQGMLQGNMKKKEFRIHPTQKPCELYRWLLLNYAKQGDKILDTHLGSQSSRIAAYDLGFDFWGFETDKHYFDEGNKRFNNHIKQIRLF